MLSAATTKQIFDNLNIELPEIEYADISIDISLPAELCTVLKTITNRSIFQKIKRKKVEKRFNNVPCDYFPIFKLCYEGQQRISLKTLIEMLEILNHNQLLIDQLSKGQIAALEEYRLCIMRAVYQEIDAKG